MPHLTRSCDNLLYFSSEVCSLSSLAEQGAFLIVPSSFSLYSSTVLPLMKLSQYTLAKWRLFCRAQKTGGETKYEPSGTLANYCSDIQKFDRLQISDLAITSVQRF